MVVSVAERQLNLKERFYCGLILQDMPDTDYTVEAVDLNYMYAIPQTEDIQYGLWPYYLDTGCPESMCTETCQDPPQGVSVYSDPVVMAYSHCSERYLVAFTSATEPLLIYWFSTAPGDGMGWVQMFSSVGYSGVNFTDATMSPDCRTIYITETTRILTVDVETGDITQLLSLPEWQSLAGIAFDCDNNILYVSAAASNESSFLLAIDPYTKKIIASIEKGQFEQLWMNCSYVPSSSSESFSSESSSSESSSSTPLPDIVLFGMNPKKRTGDNQTVKALSIFWDGNETTVSDHCEWRPEEASRGNFSVDYSDVGYAYIHDPNAKTPSYALMSMDYDVCSQPAKTYAKGLSGEGQVEGLVYVHCIGMPWMATFRNGVVSWFLPKKGVDWGLFKNFTTGNSASYFIDSAISRDCGSIFMTDTSSKQIYRLNLATGSTDTVVSLSSWDHLGGLALDCDTDLLYQVADVNNTGSRQFLLGIDHKSNSVVTTTPLHSPEQYTQLMYKTACKYTIIPVGLYGMMGPSCGSENCTTTIDAIQIYFNVGLLNKTSCDWIVNNSYAYVQFGDYGSAWINEKEGPPHPGLVDFNYAKCAGTKDVYSTHIAPDGSVPLAGVFSHCAGKFWLAVYFPSATQNVTWFEEDATGWHSLFSMILPVGSTPSERIREAAFSADCKAIFVVDKQGVQILRVNPTDGDYTTLISLAGYPDLGGIAMDCGSNTLYLSAIPKGHTDPVIHALDPSAKPEAKIVGTFSASTLYPQLLSQYDCPVPLSTSTSFSTSSASSPGVISPSMSTSVSTSTSNSKLVSDSTSLSSSQSLFSSYSSQPVFSSSQPLSSFSLSLSLSASTSGDSSDTLLSQSSSDGRKGKLGIALGLALGLGVPLIAGCMAGLIMFLLWKSRQSNGPEEGACAVEMTPLLKLSDLSRFDKSLSLDPFLQVPVEKFSLQVTPASALDFELGTHQAPVGSEVKQVMTVANPSKSAVAFKVLAPQSHKYTLRFSETPPVLKAGEEIDVEVSLIALCTASINTDVIIMTYNNKAEAQNFVALKINLDSMISTCLDHEEIHLTREIGEGAYGVVWVGSWREQEVAVKVVKNQEGKSSATEFFTEIRILESVRCPQIVHYFGAVKTPGKFCIVTEFFPLGNLHSCMKTHPFSLPLKLKCLIDCTTGMSFIHKAGLLHRDLKPDNLLVASLDVNAAVNCKITDFGTCRDTNKTDQTQAYTVGVGTPTYMPPELLSNGKYKQSADVYSFAILMYQVISEKEPYSEINLKSLWKITEFVLSGQRLPLDGIPPELAEVITACWDQDHHKRPSFAQTTTVLEAQLSALLKS
ncbi:tyrosine protein kinase [Pelomyxa schiedti]|nr:tyrosine protein kinase [Pelomyxa schiedti]